MSRVRWQITAHSLAFLIGVSTVFVALGYSAGIVGDIFFEYDSEIRIVAGIFLILMGIVMLRVLPIPFLNRDFRAHMARKPDGFFGSAVVGLAFGAGWTPCIGPILGGILAIASAGGNATQGGLLLAVYSIGFGIPFMLAAQALTAWRKLNKYAGIIEKVGAVMLILVGLVVLLNLMSWLAPYLLAFGSVEGVLGDSAAINPSYFIAFLAGALSFLSPCVLPILPGFLAYLTGINSQKLLNPNSMEDVLQVELNKTTFGISIVGTILIALGSFLPLVNIEWGSGNLYQFSNLFFYLIILMSVIAALSIAFRYSFDTFLASIITILILVGLFVKGNGAVQTSYGWFVMLLGAILVLAGSVGDLRHQTSKTLESQA